MAAAAVLAAARPAFALCPMCLGQQSKVTPTLLVTGLLVLLPALVFLVAGSVIRRVVGRDPEG